MSNGDRAKVRYWYLYGAYGVAAAGKASRHGPPEGSRALGRDVAWVIVATRRVPDTRVGVAILAGPLVLGFVGGTFFLWRVMGAVTGSVLRNVLTARTIPLTPASEQTVMVTGAVDGAPPERIEYSLAYGKIFLRLCMTGALCAAIWWW